MVKSNVIATRIAIPNPGISGSQKFVKIVLFCMSNDKNTNFSDEMKYFLSAKVLLRAA